MKLRLSTNKKLISSALSAYVTEKFSHALRAFGHCISEARIRIDDINGPKGGIDKRCVAVLKLPKGRTLAVEGISSDAYAAIDDVAKRSKLSIARSLEKLKIKRIK